MSDKPNEVFTDERLYVVRCELLLALPKGEDPESIFDTLNMMLIPLQRRERDDKSILIDYSFDGKPVRMSIPAAGYDYDHGFCSRTIRPGSEPLVSSAYQRPTPRSAEELDEEYNQDGTGEHPVYTRSEWIIAIMDGNTVLGYWQWLANLLEEAEE